MNWNDPSERAALIDRIGPAAYNKAQSAHIEASTLITVNGHAIRPVQSRFGRLFMVGGTDRAFATLDLAKSYAAKAS